MLYKLPGPTSSHKRRSTCTGTIQQTVQAAHLLSPFSVGSSLKCTTRIHG